MKEKVNEICQLIPSFKNEIIWGRGKDASSEGKDYCRYNFKNNSYYDNIAAKESSRGRRRHCGTIEEVADMDGKILTEVIIPTMNVSRKCADGTVHSEEVFNKSQLYIGTAGYKNTYAYDKLIQTLIWSIVKPERAMVLGGTYRIPVLVKLLDKNFVKDLKMDGTFNEASFDREYESKWSGTTEDAFFSSELFDKARVMKEAEREYRKPSNSSPDRNAFYIISVDVGRKGCDSVASVFKVLPQPQGVSLKTLVNIETAEDMHFEDQAIWLKKLYYRYHANRLVIDANGIGVGLVDYLVKSQTDKKTGETYPDFGVFNDKDNKYRKYKTPLCEQNALYLIIANVGLNTEAYVNVQNQLASGKVRLLIDERLAKLKLMDTKVGKAMRPEDRTIYLQPYTRTSMLKEEIMNLREEREGINIILKQANANVPKDKFSSFIYGLYYIVEEYDKKNKRKKFNVKSLMFMN